MLKEYEIKLRLFPPLAEIENWFKEDPEAWVWGIGALGENERFNLIYARRVTSDAGREGISCKFSAIVSDESLEPSLWDWERITEVPKSRVEFIRAKIIREFAEGEFATCYHCDKPFPANEAWKDYDGDVYCSKEHLFEVMSEGFDPDGTEVEQEDS